MFGGKTLRVNLVTRMEIVDDLLEIQVESLALGGVPIPSAWMADVKSQNIFAELFPDEESQRTVMAGIDTFEVKDGEIVFVLAE